MSHGKNYTKSDPRFMNFAQARQLWVFVEFRQQQRPRLYDPGHGILLTLNVELNIRLVISFIHPYCRDSRPVEYKKTTRVNYDYVIVMTSNEIFAK
jgi:hypothetical protein